MVKFSLRTRGWRRNIPQQNELKHNSRTVFAAVIVIAGLLLLFYPWFSNWFYSRQVDSAVEVYEKEAEETDVAEKEEIFETARQYNELISKSHVALTDPFILSSTGEQDLAYETVLNLDNQGLMCFVDIPKIDVYLPVYHGTSAETLEKGAGHLEGSSVPVGGTDTHAVISAHTGINTSKMFSDLTEMEEGDLFFIHVLDETLAYRVCDIQVILPEDTSSITVEPGRDLVSLITCTPYGINTHRLVVTGERTEYTDAIEDEAQGQRSDEPSVWMQEYRKALTAGLCMVILAVSIIYIVRAVHHFSRKKHQNRN